MAVAWVQGTSVNVASGTSGGASITPAAGNLMTSFIRGGTNVSNTLGVSDGTNTWNNGGNVSNTADASDTHGDFYSANVAGSAVTVTVTQSQAGHSLRATIDEFSGCATSSPLNDHGDGGSSSATSGTATTVGSSTASGDLVVSWAGNGNGVTFAAGSGYTLQTVVPAAGTSRCATEWAIGAGGSTTATITWGGTAAAWVEHVTTFKAASTSGLPPGLGPEEQMDIVGMTANQAAMMR